MSTTGRRRHEDTTTRLSFRVVVSSSDVVFGSFLWPLCLATAGDDVTERLFAEVADIARMLHALRMKVEQG